MVSSSINIYDLESYFRNNKGADKRAVLHDAECFETIQQLELEHKGGINDFLWLNDRYIVSAADDATIRIFDIEQVSRITIFEESDKIITNFFVFLIL